MRWSKYFLPTLKEDCSLEKEPPGVRFLLRAGMVKQLASGIYTYLPFGLAVLRRVEDVVRREMNRAGALELLMPALQPASLWQESNRYEMLGTDIVSFLFQDRHHRELLLGPTHEEVILEVVRREISSHKQLPLILYQVQTKFRDEMRPRFGLVRCREFLMKDAYSFDRDEEDLDKSYRLMSEAYHCIFRQLGIKYRVEQADSGAMGGRFSEEFVARGECPELEIGHIFKLGTTYAETMKGLFLDEHGKQRPYLMGCYGIGVSRLLVAIIENNHDRDGIIWPLSAAPFQLHILPVNYQDPETRNLADKIYLDAQEHEIPSLLDDRPRSAGEKFKDADLIGLPFRVTVGKTAREGKVEFKKRAEPDKTTVMEPARILEIVHRIRRKLS